MRWYPISRASCLVWFPLLALLPARAFGADETVGFVLVQVGEWELAGKPPRPIAEGQRLPGGATVRPKVSSTPNPKKTVRPKLTVCLDTGKAIAFTASGTVPMRPADSRKIWIWSAIIGQSMGGYVHPVSRGVGHTKNISDSVVKLAGDGIDPDRTEPPAVFDSLPAGELRLRFDPIAPTREGAPATVRFTWDPGKPRPIPAVGLRPGLYNVTIMQQDDQVIAEAWVLLTRSASYDQAAGHFREARDRSEQWDREIDPSAVRKFRRLSLKALAEHPKR